MSLRLGGINNALHNNRAVGVVSGIHIVQQDADRAGSGGSRAFRSQGSTRLDNGGVGANRGRNLDRYGLVVLGSQDFNAAVETFNS